LVEEEPVLAVTEQRSGSCVCGGNISAFACLSISSNRALRSHLLVLIVRETAIAGSLCLIGGKWRAIAILGSRHDWIIGEVELL
jgi:hypothetical protein